MKTLHDIYLIVRRDCCYGLCPIPDKIVCCDMHIIAEIMISEGEY